MSDPTPPPQPQPTNQPTPAKSPSQQRPPARPASRRPNLRPWFFALGIVWLITNLISFQLGLASLTPKHLFFGSIPFLAALAVLLMLHFKGKKITIFALTPAVFFFLLLEIAGRVYVATAGPDGGFLGSPRTREITGEFLFEPHHYSLYNLNPRVHNAEGLYHNSLGLRDHREFAKDPTAIRIVVIGGSTTYTYRVRENEKIYSYGLERLLNEHYKDKLAGRHIEVINAGMSDATSAENVVRMIYFVSELDPDLVVIQHGFNDVFPRARRATISTDYHEHRKMWSEPDVFTFDDSIAYTLTDRVSQWSVITRYVTLRAGLTQPIALGYYITRPGRDGEAKDNLERNDTRFFERNTRMMIALANEMGAETMLVTVPITERAGKGATIAVPQHNALLKDIAGDTGSWFFDFEKLMNKDEAHMPDGCHVSELGSDLKRDLFYDHFVQANIVEQLSARHHAAAILPIDTPRDAASSNTDSDTGTGTATNSGDSSP